MKNTTGYVHAAGVAYVLYLLSVAPFFYLSVVDLVAEWQAASRGDSTDPAEHAAMGALAFVAAMPALVFFLLAAVGSLYVLWRGSGGQRLRVASWYGALFFILMAELFGPDNRDFSQRVYFSLYEILLQAPLLALPALWLWRDRRYYIPSLAKPHV